MIPTEVQIKQLWEKYQVPENKRRHLELVVMVAEFIALRMLKAGGGLRINIELLKAAALLHDIDKNAAKLPGEKHPDAAVRILNDEGMWEVADLVATHPLHLINDPVTAPQSWEEKILFLSDKMVKYEIITVDQRFDLWNAEDLSPTERQIFTQAYPKVKQLETEILGIIQLKPEDISIILSKPIN
jgi:hypothetical protein